MWNNAAFVLGLAVPSIKNSYWSYRAYIRTNKRPLDFVLLVEISNHVEEVYSSLLQHFFIDQILSAIRLRRFVFKSVLFSYN